ncbi:MAG: NAD(P)H-binding protein [Pseudomonadota bacterium]
MTDQPTQKTVLLFGATGTIGRATLRALVAAGHRVTCFLRHGTHPDLPPGVAAHHGYVAHPDAVFDTTRFDAVVSCMASRTGMPRDAWAIDHDAHQTLLAAAKSAGVAQFVLLSALCVQQPELPFQHAKRAFEQTLMDSGLTYSIVRPTAFFKSLSGQVARVRGGKPFLLFGDGQLTACKPISDRDLGHFITGCLTDPARANQVLPIGGPGPAITPLQQAKMLFDLLGQTPHHRRIPVALMDGIIAGLSIAGRLSPRARDKADLARIGRYYATHSMLVWNDSTDTYEADATPETGTDHLSDFYAALIADEAEFDLGDHAIF